MLFRYQTPNKIGKASVLYFTLNDVSWTTTNQSNCIEKRVNKMNLDEFNTSQKKKTP